MVAQRVLATTLLSWIGLASPAPHAHLWGQQGPAAELNVEEALTQLGEAQRRQTPRGGRWTLAYRQRGRPKEDEVVVWDSADPDAHAANPNTVPCWLDLVLTLRVEGLADGRGQPYTGPLIARTSAAGTILGPYPEGFVCAADGAFELSYVPDFPPHTESSVGIHVSYRPAPVFIEVGGKVFPYNPDYWIGMPFQDQGLWGWILLFREPEHPADGFRMSPVTSQVVAGKRALAAEAIFSLVKGVPAAELPVRVDWELEGFPTHEEGCFSHHGVTDADGRVLDTVEVPTNVTRGRVEFWYHGAAPDYGHASGQQFDFAKPHTPAP